jgi:hypothetical protein
MALSRNATWVTQAAAVGHPPFPLCHPQRSSSLHPGRGQPRTLSTDHDPPIPLRNLHLQSIVHTVLEFLNNLRGLKEQSRNRVVALARQATQTGGIGFLGIDSSAP